jgi:hypothetical protein
MLRLTAEERGLAQMVEPEKKPYPRNHEFESNLDLGDKTTRQPRTGAQRTDWTVVLSELPNRFSAADVQKLADKPSSEIFAGIARWTKAGSVVRVERGVYTKTAAMRKAAPDSTPASKTKAKTKAKSKPNDRRAAA